MTPWNRRKAQQRNEEGQYPAFEALLGVHRLDYWHNTIAQRSQAGWPDYTLFGDGWHAWVELKARRANGTPGKLGPDQERYRDAIQRAGGEWRMFLLPDQWSEIHTWLRSHTGIETYDVATGKVLA